MALEHVLSRRALSISACPVRKSRMSPGGWCTWMSSTVSTEACDEKYFLFRLFDPSIHDLANLADNLP